MKKFGIFCLAVVLVLSVTACSSPADSSSVPADPVCEHQWNPATFTAPETCALCGATQGEPKADYFQENNIPVQETLPEGTLPLTFITYQMEDPSAFLTREGTALMTQSIQPSQREGYKDITLEVVVELSFVLDEVTMEDWNYSWGNSIYDLYTGRQLPARDLFGSGDSFDYQADVTYDGVTYEIFYSKKNESTDSGWYDTADGGRALDEVFHQTYIFSVPEEYDGLVYALVPTYAVPEIDNENIDESESYAKELEEDGELEETAFVRFGRENPALEEQPQQGEPTETPAAGSDTSGSSTPEGYEQCAYGENKVTILDWSAHPTGDSFYSGPVEFEITVEYETQWENAWLDLFVISEEDGGRHLYTAIDNLDTSLEESTGLYLTNQPKGQHTFSFTYTPVKVEGSPYILQAMLQPSGAGADDILKEQGFTYPYASVVVFEQ